MSLGTAIYSHLTGITAITNLVGLRIFPGKAPDSVNPKTQEYIVWRKASNDHTRHLGGSSGLTAPRIIFDIFGRSYELVEPIVTAMRASLDGLRDPTMGSGNLDVRNIRLETDDDDIIVPADGSDRGEFTARMDFIITHAESVPTL